ncbi:hypothetical protein [Gluconobacter oxydans]|uniref:hypothetical protein n=1 Tax=Gluconobacter oxydans TaxID=442 RepID=UPI000ACBB1DB|nr:hypothetical protein [Gluconobacter oxydans]
MAFWMKLNHINLCTSNVPALSPLFEKHFRFILDDPQEVRTRHANLCADGYLPGPVEGMTRGRDC